VTESTPVAKCVARLNCSKCDEVVFTGSTFLPVIAGSDYQISVQVIREDTGLILEDYGIVDTISFPKPTDKPRTPSKFGL